MMGFLRVLCLLGLAYSVSGAGEMTILESPESIVFSGDEELDLSNVRNVLSTALGFTIPESKRWSGMVVKNPFRFAEAVVVVAVGGVGGLGMVEGHAFPVRTDEALHTTWDLLQFRVEERYPSLAPNLTLLRLPLDQPSVLEEYFGDLSKSTEEGGGEESEAPTTKGSPEEQSFASQLNLLDTITDKISGMGVKSDGLVDIYWVDVTGLHGLVDSFGEDSSTVARAKASLASSLLLLSDVFATLYDDKVIFATLASDVVHTRRYRRDTNASDTTSSSPVMDDSGDSEYAVIFNIILWFSVAFAFSLLAVSIGIATMDPGRDSIIYRMTSNRMKKDN